MAEQSRVATCEIFVSGSKHHAHQIRIAINTFLSEFVMQRAELKFSEGKKKKLLERQAWQRVLT
jgi:hypothetical protein